MHTQANESHYNALVWGTALTAGVSAYLFLADPLVALVPIFVLGAAMVMLLGYAGHKRRKKKILFAYSRPNSIIVADVITEAIKLGLLSILLDATSSGTTFQVLTTGIATVEKWDFARLCIVIGIMIIMYWVNVGILYPPHALRERRLIAKLNDWSFSDVE